MTAIAPDAWRGFEDRNGPVWSIALWVVAAAVTLLGLRRARAAGVLLVVLGAAPWLVASFRYGGFGSLGAVTSPSVVAGGLYLFAAGLGARPPADGPVSPEPARSGR